VATVPRMPWTLADLPELNGRVTVVTGGNGGIGLEAAEALAGAGAHVVLACRNLGKADAAAARIRGRHQAASLEIVELDLASQASTRAAADRLLATHHRLDLLILNAGVMAIPRKVTEDGWEMQLATNHLGHFSFAGLLADRLLTTERPRVVTITSLMHKPGRIDFDDLHGERRYSAWGAYCQSKLANLLFARELHRRLSAAGSAAMSVAAHPGYTATDLQAVGPRERGSRLMEQFTDLGNRLIGQSPAMGALPTLYAACAAGLSGGELVGPGRLFESRGHPKVVRPAKKGLDEAVGRRLWHVSEQLTGVVWPV
jgi:NAD(P)-dependent dehydrogenase (short-subunit alcohol dehydrogenase family)